MKSAAVFFVLVAFTISGGETWTRNTFPGEGHKARPDQYPPGQGSDRCEWINGFGVSPADPTFMLEVADMGHFTYSTDGRYFQMAEVPVRGGKTVAFNPHNGNVGYVLTGADGTNTSGLGGWWRTEDKGKTWQLFYQAPEDSYEWCGRPHGKRLLVVDPQPARSNQIWFASMSRGLVRTVDDGENWAVAAFEGHCIASLAAGVGAEGQTVLYAIVAHKFGSISDFAKFGGLRKKYNASGQGELWRLDIKNDGTFTKQRVLPEFSNISDVEINPTDPSRGLVIVGRTELRPFTDGGLTLGEAIRDKSNTNGDLSCVYINPWNPKHFVLLDRGSASEALQYSSDGGATWAGDKRTIVDGHIPSLLAYGPHNHKAAPHYQFDADRGGIPTRGAYVISFLKDQPKSVVMLYDWWAKVPLRSDDYGKTFTPFAYGGQFKQPVQMATAQSGKALALGRMEYGMVCSSDAGMSWRHYGHYNDSTIKFATYDSPDLKRGGWMQKSCTGIGIKPDNARVMVACYSHGPAKMMRSGNFGATWERTGEFNSKFGPYRDTGCAVYWHRQKTGVVYCGPLKSTDAGLTWKKMDNRVLAMSSANGDILLGSMYAPSAKLTKRAPISVSFDGGETWKEITDVPKEPSHIPASQANEGPDPVSRNVVSLSLVIQGFAIDPAMRAGDPLRFLMAGRKGIYEYVAGAADGSGGTWAVHNKGFEVPPCRGIMEPVYWMGQVTFDPRPGKSHIVYAVQNDNAMGYWSTGKNKNQVAPRSMHNKALYRSTDSGKTWQCIVGESFPGIPKLSTIGAIHVADDGRFYAQDFTGQYSLPSIEPGDAPLAQTLKPGGFRATPLSTTSIQLMWDECANEAFSHWTLSRDKKRVAAKLTEPVFIDEDLAPGTRYTYVLSAVDKNGKRVEAMIHAATPETEDISSGLLLHLSFDEGEGEAVRDAVDPQREVQFVNGRGSMEGVVGPRAVKLDGIDDQIIVSDKKLELRPRRFITIAGWFRATEEDWKSWGRILACNGYQIFSSRGNLNFIVRDVGTLSAPVPTAADEWVHITGVYDGSSIKLYYNGHLVAEKAGEGLIGYYKRGGLAIVPGIKGKSNTHWGGGIDDLRIYERALTVAEINALCAIGEQ